MCAILASVDGVVSDPAVAHVPVTDEGLLRGDGVFEVSASTAGGRSRWTSTCAGMARSAANLRLEIDLGAVAADVDALLDEAGAGRRRAADPRHARRPPVVLLGAAARAAPRRSRWRRVTYAPTRILDGVKSLSYAREHARHAAGAGAGRRRGAAGHARTAACWRRRRRRSSASLGRRDALHAAARATTSSTRSRAAHAGAPAAAREERRHARRAAAARREAFLASTTREVQPVARDRRAPSCAAAPGRSPQAAASAFAAHIRAPRLAPREGPHRHRQPPAVRQGGGRLAAAARAPRGAARPHRPAPRRRAVARSSSTSSACRGPSVELRHRRRHATPSRPRGCSPRSGRCWPTSGPTSCSSTATRTRRSPAALAAAQARHPGRPRRGRACARSTARCPRSSTAC